LRIDPARSAIEAVHDCPGKGAHQIAMLPDESKLYVSAKEGDLAAFDLKRAAFTARVPLAQPGIERGNGTGGEGVMPTPDGRRLVVIDNWWNDLRIIDTATDTEVDRVRLAQIPPANPKRSMLAKAMYSPDGRTLVVTAYAGGAVWIINAADLRRQTVVPVPKGPQGMAFPPDGGSIIVACHDSGALARIDLGSGLVSRIYDGGNGIEVLAFY
jgi:DNA-binding beta-propeller fold protein YncE